MTAAFPRFCAAERRDDRRVLEETAREQMWILEEWNRHEEARSLDWRLRSEYQDQMTLDFGLYSPGA